MNLNIPFRITGFALALLSLSLLTAAAQAGDPPKVGDKAPDFSLKSLDGQTVQLSKLTANGKVVLVLLRGWPGYQCPICDRQVHDFSSKKDDFAAAKARLVFVYP